MTSEFQQHPQRRLNALTGEWVFVSPHRSQRPWQGRVEAVSQSKRPRHDPACYLCAGNQRAGGQRNPDYAATHVFPNDFSAFRSDTPPHAQHHGDLLVARTQRGTCKVLCFSPRHDLTLADLTPQELRQVIEMWIEETKDLGRSWRWVQVFENKGEIMGCSNPHPHGQIWAGDFVPNEPAKEMERQCAWFANHSSSLLLDYMRLEIASGERIVTSNDEWAAIVPWWAVWPFETLLVPRRPARRLDDLDEASRNGLAAVLENLLGAYDRLFGVPFPYSMGWHGAPYDGAEHPEWTVHAHFYPPLLRSASVKKFMVGFELLGEAQRDMTPEAAAQRLRAACASKPEGQV
jgi:UDPglucose--hexose-1-phosphate uridylyltransferase